MAGAKLGELLGAASGQLRVAAQPSVAGIDSESAAAAARHARLAGLALSRLLDVVIGTEQAEVVMTWDPESVAHAAVHAREALGMAVASLQAASSGLGPAAAPTGPAAALASAASSLRAGHDLLRSHVTTDPDGLRSATSHWAAVLGSDDFAGALLDQAGRQADQLGTCMLALSSATAGNPLIPAWVREELAVAHRWLHLAGDAAGAASRSSPVTTAGKMLVQALPVSVYPDRIPLVGAEPVTGLCEGISVSAERLRAVARWPADQAAWMPVVTADSWRWTATATAVASDLTEVLLRTLAARAGEPGGLPAVAKRPLSVAASAAANACVRWGEVTGEWSDLTTETRGITGPGVADSSDLVIRLGRLAFADPQWAPARSRRAPVRDPEDLAPGLAEVCGVVGAVHDAADALLRTAQADLRSVDLAAWAGRLYRPVRSAAAAPLRRSDHFIRRFDRVVPAATSRLQEAYRAAIDASGAFAGTLDVLAVMLDAPTSVLAAARAAGQAQQRERTNRRSIAAPMAEGQADAAVMLGFKIESYEQGVRDLGVCDPMILLRARAADHAGRQILLVAADMASKEQAQAADTAKQTAVLREPGPAAKLAGRYFPKAASPTAGRRQAPGEGGRVAGAVPLGKQPRVPRRPDGK